MATADMTDVILGTEGYDLRRATLPQRIKLFDAVSGLLDNRVRHLPGCKPLLPLLWEEFKTNSLLTTITFPNQVNEKTRALVLCTRTGRVKEEKSFETHWLLKAEGGQLFEITFAQEIFVRHLKTTHAYVRCLDKDCLPREWVSAECVIDVYKSVSRQLAESIENRNRIVSDLKGCYDIIQPALKRMK